MRFLEDLFVEPGSDMPRPNNCGDAEGGALLKHAALVALSSLRSQAGSDSTYHTSLRCYC